MLSGSVRFCFAIVGPPLLLSLNHTPRRTRDFTHSAPDAAGPRIRRTPWEKIGPRGLDNGRIRTNNHMTHTPRPLPSALPPPSHRLENPTCQPLLPASCFAFWARPASSP